MSRGIDIKEINMVVNYDVPNDAEDYVHRVGRTARANTKGEALTLVNEKDMYKIRKIEKLIDSSVPKLNPPENLGPGPEWKEESPNKKYGKSKGSYKGKKKGNYNKKHSGGPKKSN
jgi:superfamily II DNA/RNA helicase